ncbi:DNRLRE domain-containing protein [Kribbella sp. NBC_01505]|uniref:LamG-like jellyroll fold domain-containing protein n=1 Tax=Kribbella sp. NBC_01505 TaxID=2903580 RepID=UPI003868EA6E
MLVALAVLTTGLHAVPAVAAPPPIPKVGRDQAEAMKFAAAGGARVEIADRTTELSQTFANPDGSLTSKVSNGPVRVKRDGVWNAIDTTLEFRPDGTVGPKNALSDIALSGGGSGPVGKVGLKEGTFELKSPWTLPRPSLSGSTATYGEVLQGVDLVVDSTSEGLSYNLVVKSREAASNPALRSIKFPVTTAGLSLRANRPGGPAYVDKTGRLIMSAGDAIMWDAAQTGAQSAAQSGAQGKQAAAARSSAELVSDGPAGTHSTAMQLRGDPTGLTMVPDAKLLTNPTTVYPVVLDPVLKTVTRASWAAAWQLYPTTSFYKTTHSLGVGFEDFEQHKIVRSFWQFDTTLFRGKTVLSANFRTYETHSANCTAHSVTVTRTAPITTATTWNKQPAVQLAAGSKSFAHGYNTSCPDAYEEIPVTNSMIDTATKGYTTSTFRMTATSETDGLAWKQFSSFGELEVNYVTPPDVPRRLGLTDPAVGCDDASSPVNVGSNNIQFGVTPVLKGNVNEGLKVYTEIYLYSTTGNSFRMLRTGLVAPGIPQTVTIPSTDIPDGQLVHFRARTIYPYSSTGSLASAFTIYCYFKVDRSAPPAPIVTAKYGSTDVPNCVGATRCDEIVPLGDALSVTIKGGAPDVVRHEYWFQGQTARGAASGLNVVKSLVPPQEGYNMLHVVSYDGASHASKPRDYLINVKSASPPVASWSFDDGQGTTAADSASPAHPLTLSGGAAFDDAGRDGGSLKVDGVDDFAQTAVTPVDTSKSFTVSAWARVTSAKEAVVVGAAGNIGSAFELYYSLSLNRWVFLRMKTDAMSPVNVKATSDEPAVLGAWTHLVGVYDQGLGRMQLYVNGRLQTAGNVAYPDSAWKATGPLSVGQGQYNDVFTNRFPGSVDSVNLWQRALDAKVIMGLTDLRKDGSVVVRQAARWPLDTATLGTDNVWRTPETVFGANMIMSGFGGAGADQAAAFVEDDDRGKVLQFTGAASEALSLPRPVVDAGTTFSAAVWVKLSDASKPAVVARQAGADRDAWRLAWEPLDSLGGQWVFTRARADGTGENRAVFPEDNDAATSDWRLLVGTYDANATGATNQDPLGDIELTVDKTPVEGGTDAYTSPYRLGSTVVGKGRATGSEFAGLVDDFRLYVGPLVDNAVCVEFPELGDGVCPPPAG